MKFPSIKTLLQNIADSFLRFPLAILISIFGTSVAVYLIDHNFTIAFNQDFYLKLLMTSVLGLSLFIFLNLISEKQGKGKQLSLMSNILGILILVGYYFSLPDKIDEMHGYRFALFILALHCFVAFAPYIKKGQTNGFWQFNKSLFLHFLVSALYSAVLYIGLALAMLAVENLFDVTIKGERYGQLWAIIVGIFNTWFFLAGIPKDFAKLDEDKTYPKGLKVFTQWILLPLVLLYLLILYLYSAKILILSDWPSGWVAYLVLGFSVVGIFSLLLVYPIKNEENNKWIRVFTRFFYWALLPLIVLLFIAIWKRISEYGITENRYYVLILAFWLMGIAVYQIIKKFNNIKIIPISLGLIALLSSFGPWSAFSVSRNSQFNRMISVLEKNNILVDNKITKSRQELSFEDRKDISSTIEYLVDMHGYEMFKPYFNENLDSMFVDTLYNHTPTKLLELMGLEYISRWQTEDYYTNNFYFTTSDYSNSATSITGYDYLLDYDSYYYNYYDNDSIYTSKYKLDSVPFIIKYDTITNSILFTANDSVSNTFQLSEFISELRKNYTTNEAYNIPLNEMEKIIEDDNLKIKIKFVRISGSFVDDKMNINEIASQILIRLKFLKEDQIINQEGLIVINI